MQVHVSKHWKKVSSVQSNALVDLHKDYLSNETVLSIIVKSISYSLVNNLLLSVAFCVSIRGLKEIINHVSWN